MAMADTYSEWAAEVSGAQSMKLLALFFANTATLMLFTKFLQLQRLVKVPGVIKQSFGLTSHQKD
jgi:hypothetical protein